MSTEMPVLKFFSSDCSSASSAPAGSFRSARSSCRYRSHFSAMGLQTPLFRRLFSSLERFCCERRRGISLGKLNTQKPEHFRLCVFLCVERAGKKSISSERLKVVKAYKQILRNFSATQNNPWWRHGRKIDSDLRFQSSLLRNLMLQRFHKSEIYSLRTGYFNPTASYSTREYSVRFIVNKRVPSEFI